MKRVMILLLCLSANLLAASRADYQARVKEAAQIAQTAAAAGQDESVANHYERLAKLLPITEDVTDGEQTIHINNAWLHEQLKQLDQLAADGDETLAAQWQALAAYLNALNTRVNDAGLPLPAAFTLDRAQLDSILARSEYKHDERQSSAIQQWLKRLWNRLRDWLRSLFSGVESEPTLPGQGSVNIARVIIITLLGLALAYALYKLYQWWQRRQPRQKKDGVREILGVEITEETTTEDLLAAARTLAQQGDYRGAIRRAYIALLYELEQRGKLRLHRAKTNRDYLDALRHEAGIYPLFFVLTNHFERIWYGQTRATAFDFEGFLNGYREALK